MTMTSSWPPALECAAEKKRGAVNGVQLSLFDKLKALNALLSSSEEVFAALPSQKIILILFETHKGTKRKP